MVDKFKRQFQFGCGEERNFPETLIGLMEAQTGLLAVRRMFLWRFGCNERLVRRFVKEILREGGVKDGGENFLSCLALTVLVFTLSSCGGGKVVQFDRQPPQIRQVQVSPDTLIAMGKQVTVTATVVDAESGLKEVVAEVTYPDDSSARISLAAQGNDRFQGNFVVQWNPNVPLEFERWVVRMFVKAKTMRATLLGRQKLR